MKQWNMIKEENVIRKKGRQGILQINLSYKRKEQNNSKQRIEQRIKTNKQKNT